MLAISGAHLAIMMGLVWSLLRLLLPRPPRAAAVVLLILALYLLAIPPRVPILRAGIMAAAYCGAYMIGRRWRALDPLALALIIVLLWRPQDIVDGGLQLSFGIVAGLIVFGPRIYSAIVHSSAFIAASDPTRRWLFNVLGGYVVIQFVAFALALPLAAYHFQIICPLTIPLVMFALPVITVLLGLG
jgi:competence protein ComEC